MQQPRNEAGFGLCLQPLWQALGPRSGGEDENLFLGSVLVHLALFVWHLLAQPALKQVCFYDFSGLVTLVVCFTSGFRHVLRPFLPKKKAVFPSRRRSTIKSLPNGSSFSWATSTSTATRPGGAPVVLGAVAFGDIAIVNILKEPLESHLEHISTPVKKRTVEQKSTYYTIRAT